MKAYQTVFERREKKYLLTADQYQQILAGLLCRMQEDEYGQSTVESLYFDTPDHRLIRTSLEKPVYKEKLRLRSYGTPSRSSTVFVELKKKYRGVVYKRRVDLPLWQAEQWLLKGEPLSDTSQIIRELNWFLGRYADLRPAMMISCQRAAYTGKEDAGLRVTFDRDILWRETGLTLSEGAGGEALLRAGCRLMELKVPGAVPLWLSRLLSEVQAFPVSFSKYGNAYLRSLGDTHFNCFASRKGETLCA